MLQMRVAGKNDVEMLLGGLYERMAQGDIRLHEIGRTLFCKQARIGDYLVVARTAGMKTGAGFADIGNERLLDGHVDVLVVDVKDEFARLDALLYAVETRHDEFHVFEGNDPLCSQHARMRLRSGDVLPPPLKPSANAGSH